MQNLIQIENNISNYLQKDIEFVLEDKILKSGKLILFSIKGFYLTFNLSINSKIIVFELPYPFDIKYNKGNISFIYKTEKILSNNIDAQCRTLLYTSKKNHKYIENTIFLKEKF